MRIRFESQICGRIARGLPHLLSHRTMPRPFCPTERNPAVNAKPDNVNGLCMVMSCVIAVIATDTIQHEVPYSSVCINTIVQTASHAKHNHLNHTSSQQVQIIAWCFLHYIYPTIRTMGQTMTKANVLTASGKELPHCVVVDCCLVCCLASLPDLRAICSAIFLANSLLAWFAGGCLLIGLLAAPTWAWHRRLLADSV